MPRLGEVSLATVRDRGHKAGEAIYKLIFGDRDPIAEPGALRLEFDDVDKPIVEVPDPAGNFGGLFDFDRIGTTQDD